MKSFFIKKNFNIVSARGYNEYPILECQPEGNKATIKFVGGRDGNTYQAVLTFDPKTKKITVSDRKRLGEEEFGECYVDDGLVFSK